MAIWIRIACGNVMILCIARIVESLGEEHATIIDERSGKIIIENEEMNIEENGEKRGY